MTKKKPADHKKPDSPFYSAASTNCGLGKEKEKSKRISWAAWLKTWNTYVAVAIEEHPNVSGLAANMG